MSTDPNDNQQSEDDSTFLVTTGLELREKCGLTTENYPIIKLDPQNVPSELHPLIPYAEVWGITDDYYRGNVLEKASPETLRALVQTVHAYIEPLGKWLRTEYMERYRSGGARAKEQAAFLGLVVSAVEAKGLLEARYGEAHEL